MNYNNRRENFEWFKRKKMPDYEEKLEIYTKIIEKENELSAYNSRGNIYFLLEEYEKALFQQGKIFCIKKNTEKENNKEN